jgi:hypothetical protein
LSFPDAQLRVFGHALARAMMRNCASRSGHR